MELLSKNDFAKFQQFAAKSGIICFIIPDAYKESHTFTEPCWRGMFVWKDKDGNIVEDDCGSSLYIDEIQDRLMINVKAMLMGLDNI